jgi:hypothetical protein
VLDGKPGRGTRRRGRTSPAASPTSPGAAGQHGAPTWVSSDYWARRALGRAGGRCVRPSPAWARRRRCGDGAGDLTRAGARMRERDGVRRGVHARQVTSAGGQGWGRDGASRWCMAEPGSAPWAAASTAPAVGWRERDEALAGCSGRPRTWRPLPLVTVRATHMAMAGSRRRGRPMHGGERRRRHEKGPKARPCLPGYGARVLGCTPARKRRGTHGRTRARDASTPTRRGGDQTRWRPTARGVG